MESIKRLFGIAFVLLQGMTAFSQIRTAITMADFQPILGNWEGTLTYLDYSTHKPFTMPANLSIQQIGHSSRILFANQFPDEPNANWTDTIVISEDGAMINDETIVSKKILENGDVEWITEVMGKDGNDEKPALLRYTYYFGSNEYYLKKNVQFVGETEWIQRHLYSYRR